MIRPINKNVLLEPIAAEETVGTIVLPESARDNTKRAIVRARSDDANESITEGVEVFYRVHVGVVVNVEGVEMILMDDQHVLAVVEQ